MPLLPEIPGQSSKLSLTNQALSDLFKFKERQILLRDTWQNWQNLYQVFVCEPELTKRVSCCGSIFWKWFHLFYCFEFYLYDCNGYVLHGHELLGTGCVRAILMMTSVALCGIMVVHFSVGLIVTGVAHNEGLRFLTVTRWSWCLF